MPVTKGQLRVGSIVRVDDFPDSSGDYTENRRVLVVYLGPGLDDQTFLAAGISTLHGFQEVTNGTILPHRKDGHPQTSLNRKSAVTFDWIHSVSVSQAIEVTGYCPPTILAAVLEGIQATVARKKAELSKQKEDSGK